MAQTNKEVMKEVNQILRDGTGSHCFKETNEATWAKTIMQQDRVKLQAESDTLAKAIMVIAKYEREIKGE